MTTAAVIRADGSTQLGHGHVFRTLTLAIELAKRGWGVHFVCRDLEGAPLDRVRGAGFGLDLLPPEIDETGDAEAVVRAARRTAATWVVVDRYATGEAAHRHWRRRGLEVLAIDDICGHPFPVDILLNQNPGAHDLPYETSDDTTRLLGPRYALVREAYRTARPPAPRTIGEVRRVMVFMGGTDPDDATGRVLAALEGVDRGLDVEIVVGSGYPHFGRLHAAARASRHHVEVHRDLPDLVEPMKRADAAVTAGGSATWELCCMGVPTLLMPFAENQAGGASSAHRLGAAGLISESAATVDLERWLGDPGGLTRLAAVAHDLADGRGAARVVVRMRARSLELRPASLLAPLPAAQVMYAGPRMRVHSEAVVYQASEG